MAFYFGIVPYHCSCVADPSLFRYRLGSLSLKMGKSWSIGKGSNVRGILQ